MGGWECLSRPRYAARSFVAIKVLSPEVAANPRSRERFAREARVVSKLTHPHICTLYDLGLAQVADLETPFLVMELLDGETLATRLARGALSLEQTIGSPLKSPARWRPRMQAASCTGTSNPPTSC